MMRRFSFSIDEKPLEVQRARLKEKAAERTLIRLEQATGWVLIEGLFKIQPIEGGFCKLVYLHPVKEYLPDHVGPVTISVLIQSQSIESHVTGNYTQSVGKQIPLRI